MIGTDSTTFEDDMREEGRIIDQERILKHGRYDLSRTLKDPFNPPSYTISISCSNCIYVGNVTISRGTHVTGYPCPHCGCRTLQVTFKPSMAMC